MQKFGAIFLSLGLTTPASAADYLCDSFEVAFEFYRSNVAQDTKVRREAFTCNVDAWLANFATLWDQAVAFDELANLFSACLHFYGIFLSDSEERFHARN